MPRLALVLFFGPAVFWAACGGVLSPQSERVPPDGSAKPLPASADLKDETSGRILNTAIRLKEPLLETELGEQQIASRMAWAAMYVVDHCPYAVVEHRPARSLVMISFGKECRSTALGPIAGTLEMKVSKPSAEDVEVELTAANLSMGGYNFSDGTWLLDTTDGKTYTVTGDPLVLTSSEGASTFGSYVSSRLDDPSVRDPLLDALLRTPAAIFFIASTLAYE